MDAKGRLSNDEFLVQLTALFKKKAESGTVFLEQKRLTPYDAVENKHKPSPTDLSELQPSATATKHQLLFRATDGATDKTKKTKISTVVEADALDGFWTKYANTIRGEVTGLKKKDKKKTKGKKKKGGVSK
ncbi:signal recognition particle, SRP14 subunit [Limtongia smithiae]|uniref:signal recognition particle, SRP14 subunit n=1 Tax=Limtongia smithiae TaxID=1125753 RepID=UPI0034CEBC39